MTEVERGVISTVTDDGNLKSNLPDVKPSEPKQYADE